MLAGGGSASAGAGASTGQLGAGSNPCLTPTPTHMCCRHLKEDPTLGLPKRSRPSFDAGTSFGGYPQPGVAPPAMPSAYGAPHAGFAPMGGAPPGAPGGVGVVAAVQPRGYAPITNTKDNPPCNTLFIGNLGDSVNEGEMRGLFRWAQAAGARCAAAQLHAERSVQAALLLTSTPLPAPAPRAATSQGSSS